MTRDPDWQLIDRYLAGEADPAEAAIVRAWIDAGSGRKELVERLRDGPGCAPEWRVAAAWERVADRTVRAPRRGADVQPLRAPIAAPNRQPAWVWRAAAAAVLVAGSLTAWRAFANRQGSHAPLVAAAPLRELAVPRGNRASVTLGDGTQVTLNSGSLLRYPSNIDRGARDVYLEGEGFFVVTHDAARPFRVHAARSTLQDVGTRFTVRAYPGAADAAIAVVEGAVALRRDAAESQDSTLLTAGMLAQLKADGTLAVRHTNVAPYLAWTDGRLVIDDLALADAIPLLERWFDVDVRLTDPTLGARRVSAEFHGDSLAAVLSALSTAFNLELRRNGRQVTVARRQAAP